MGTLQDFRDYLANRRVVIETIETELCALQEKYETYFQEVVRVRDAELEQLEAHAQGEHPLPQDFARDLDAAVAIASEAFDQQLEELIERRDAQLAAMEKTRQESSKADHELHAQNEDLDRKEEALKARAADLIDRIRVHNERIREMGKGFGFFFNLPSMSRIRKERRALEQEQADVAANIESLRNKWVSADTAHADAQQRREAKWTRLATEAAGIETKIEALQTMGDRMIERTALEKALFSRKPDLPTPSPSDPACPRCGSANPASYHFCHVCAQRLGDDKPDAAGSLAEVAELNWHHERFSEGMKACQELIGLIRGLKSGIDAFTLSVADMQDSQRRHSLAVLQLDVPESCRAYGQSFDGVAARLQKVDHKLHPVEFARQAERLVAGLFTEEQIKGWFEGMGAELSARAEAQW